MSSHYTIKKNPSAAQPYHFVLVAENGKIILTSETYVDKQGAKTGIASCQVNSPHDDNYERKKSDALQPYSFVLKAANFKVIGRSENYADATGRDNGIESVKRNGPTTVIHDDA
ncbi:YegP family protein [Massilia sp. BJB1822]|uniref:YegP family protein n=1 Tax=Massilia sp. BJB1822 TaxID=2744470 RepID=UPI001594E6BD|nr:YegP family protein [Massilia sp. BJB1822]NVD97660.1 YegP family protein [Massilia sp. BJB1822]